MARCRADGIRGACPGSPSVRRLPRASRGRRKPWPTIRRSDTLESSFQKRQAQGGTRGTGRHTRRSQPAKAGGRRAGIGSLNPSATIGGQGARLGRRIDVATRGRPRTSSPRRCTSVPPDPPAPRGGDLEERPQWLMSFRFSKVRRSMTMQPKSWAKPLIARASPFTTTGNPI